MLFIYPPGEIEKVASQLTASWLFLSGETRKFECLTEKTLELLKHAEFTFYLPFTIQGSNRPGGIGVLIGREDAIRVAHHMFGSSREEVTQADLLDACAEACNVCAESLATHFGPARVVTVGLPQFASATEYESAAQNTLARAIYRGGSGDQVIFAVLYDSLKPEPESPSS
jgi:hypothetical protein